MWQGSRRKFLTATGAALASAGLSSMPVFSRDAPQAAADVEVLNPQNRVPLSFIIDDSTCLVNMGHFCTPQFAEAHPDRDIYQKNWKAWPREIPDAFVREFGQWCGEHGVKGKYSIVPYPACVGWMDREMPGWSRRELQASLKLVRDLMVPNWDIHPEMITHTRVIDLKTGRPLEEISSATMENSYPQEHKSVDELAAYLAYALRILRNCDLPCEGITTPGGFGNLVKPELSLAVHQAVRDVYRTEIPHYFKYVHTGKESTQPILEHVRGRGTDDVQVTVNVPAGTGDWFGGWQGDEQPEGFRYANQDGTSGRMVELIQRGEPAVMLCHWPGMYSNGSKLGFQHFQNVVTALEGRFKDQTIWMKLSEMARYWAAKELTAIRRQGNSVTFEASFASPRFTIRLRNLRGATPQLTHKAETTGLKQVVNPRDLRSGTWMQDETDVIACFDLSKGESAIIA